MRLDSVFYRLAYRAGRPAWDSDEPHPGLNEIISGRQPGRVLDLGCGTGADGVLLARHGWEVVGVDFVSAAVDAAVERARGTGSSARFLHGDVTQLHKAGVVGPFDLIIDIGCYHVVPSDLRDAYVSEVAAVAHPGADLYVIGIARRRACCSPKFLQRVTRPRPLKLGVGLRARHRHVSPSQSRPSRRSSGRLLLAQALRNSAADWLSHWTTDDYPEFRLIIVIPTRELSGVGTSRSTIALLSGIYGDLVLGIIPAPRTTPSVAVPVRIKSWATRAQPSAFAASASCRCLRGGVSQMSSGPVCDTPS